MSGSKGILKFETFKNLLYFLQKIVYLCSMGKIEIPGRHVPARPDEEFDLLVGELLIRFLER